MKGLLCNVYEGGLPLMIFNKAGFAVAGHSARIKQLQKKSFCDQVKERLKTFSLIRMRLNHSDAADLPHRR